ncbi:MAG: TetR/AcrR family transcriptional regulator [Burkholderiaceae bacterium]
MVIARPRRPPARAPEPEPAPAPAHGRAHGRAGGARPYHHGNLRQALLEAALELARLHGPERVSVREAARQVGVSPAAPFRHFPTRRALMTAMAEEAALRLRIEVAKSLGRERGDALARLRAIGRGYLAWSRRHAAHFRIVSARDEIDLDGSATLRHEIAVVRGMTEQALREAQAAGRIAARHEPAALALLARATVYGLARMQLDGHFAQWDVAVDDVPRAMEGTLALLVELMGGSGPGGASPHRK